MDLEANELCVCVCVCVCVCYVWWLWQRVTEEGCISRTEKKEGVLLLLRGESVVVRVWFVLRWM